MDEGYIVLDMNILFVPFFFFLYNYKSAQPSKRQRATKVEAQQKIKAKHKEQTTIKTKPSKKTQQHIKKDISQQPSQRINRHNRRTKQLPNDKDNINTAPLTEPKKPHPKHSSKSEKQHPPTPKHQKDTLRYKNKNDSRQQELG